MKKIVIMSIVITLGIIGQTFAHDCNLIEWDIETAAKSYEANNKEYIEFLPRDAFKQALLNMKAYCCFQEIKKTCSRKTTTNCCTQEEKDSFPKEYPESAFIFDHIVDITMRRLDGYAPLAYGIAPDPTAKERRELITKLSEAANGWTAKEIEDKYKIYRKPHNNTKESVLNNYNTNVETVSLIDKYQNLCEITKWLYENLKINDKTIIWGIQDPESYFNGCKNLVRQRVKRENGYVKILMVQKTGKMIDEVTKAYTKKHFVEEKLLELRDLITKVKNLFQDMVKQAPVSQKCSK